MARLDIVLTVQSRIRTDPITMSKGKADVSGKKIIIIIINRNSLYIIYNINFKLYR